MQRVLPSIAGILGILVLFSAHAMAQRQMENLTRGVVAIKNSDGEVYVGWRLFGTDPESIKFNVYRMQGDEKSIRLNATPLAKSTNFIDRTANADRSIQYYVRPVVGGKELTASKPVPLWEREFLEIPIQPIDEYRPGDASIADLDGDGEYEIVLHQTSRGRDNSHSGLTGSPIIDAYELDGKHLWRIDLGKNIREGQHYTQLMVYDLDGDGKAEVACKTADGTSDGTGKIIGDPTKDWRNKNPKDKTYGRILKRPRIFYDL